MVAKSRYELGNKWLQLGVKYRDESTDQWRFAKLARRLEDISANLGDSYTVSVEREQAGDSARRDLYRGFLQDALLQYAQTVLALDEMASEMAKASNFEADLQNPLVVLSMPAPTLIPSAPLTLDQTISPAPSQMFDGHSLAGWSGDTRYWSVREGAIVGRLTTKVAGGRFLSFEQSASDFALRLKFKITQGNSGVQFRSESLSDYGMRGPQVDIDSEGRFIGGLSAEKMNRPFFARTSDVALRRVKQTLTSGWNNLEVVANGNRVRIAINGISTADADFPGIPRNGKFGLQLHGGAPTEIAFKDFVLEPK